MFPLDPGILATRDLTVNRVDALPVGRIVFANPRDKASPPTHVVNSMDPYATAPTGGSDAGSAMVKAIQDKYRVDFETAKRAAAAADEAIRREVSARTGSQTAGAAAAGINNGGPIVLNTPEYELALANYNPPLAPLPASAQTINRVTGNAGLAPAKITFANPLAKKA